MNSRITGRYFFPLILVLIGGCDSDATSSDLFPAIEGMVWHYDATFQAGRKLNRHKIIVTNLGYIMLEDGTQAFARKYHNDDVAYYKKNEKGIFRIGYQKAGKNLSRDTENHFVLRFPVKTGIKWVLTSKPFFLEKSVREINAGQASLSGDLSLHPLKVSNEITSTNETVRTPAGSFSNCIRVDGSGKTTGTGSEIGKVNVEVRQTDWYAPGIGLIKSTRKETTNLKWARSSTFSMELEKYYH